MPSARGICKECGDEFFTDSENYGTDESICQKCLFEREEDNQEIQPIEKKHS